MNIPALSGSTAGLATRPVAADSVPVELKQVRAEQTSQTTKTLTERAVNQTQEVEYPREQLEDAVKQLNDFLKPINSAVQFTLDDDTGQTVVKVIDTATKEVIRQVPSEEMLNIARALDKIAGVLIQQKA
jgi:flagellar protein FlaG